MNDNPETVRLIYKYRKLIMEGKIALSLKDAKKLIGPDSVYHLYGSIKNVEEDKKEKDIPDDNA